ncbi:MAG TPA: MTH1187 family thiamine-binding protein [Rariglobus sp.]
MLADLVIIPIGNGTHTSASLSKVLKLIKDSGLPYQLTPASTCIEGTWDEIVALAKRCHAAVHADSPHLITMLRLEDDAGEARKLVENVAAVEEEAGESFEKAPALAAEAIA